MGIKYEVSAVIGQYEKDGVTKKQYANLGRVMEMKNGSLAIKIDTVPVGWDGWAYLNTPRPSEGNSGRNKPDSDDLAF